MRLDFDIGAAWATGLAMATLRAGAFTVALNSVGRAVPRVGRMAFALAMGLFLTAPLRGVTELTELVSLSLANVVVGVVLGWLVTLVFELFPVAGDLLDLSSNLSVSAVFDPTQTDRRGVLGRLFTLLGAAVFVAVGGLGLLAGVLVTSVRMIPLDGGVQLAAGPLARSAVDLTSQLVVAGLELALPVVALLFVAELVLGLAARFAPQANVFVIGLPAKLLVALSALSASIVLVPEAVDGYLDVVERVTMGTLRALGAA